jgi:predicted phage tail protein
MLRNVHLHGKLKKQFGASHRLAVANAGEALRALNCAFPGQFIEALKIGSYQLVRGDRRSGMKLNLELVNSFNLGCADLHLIPVAQGAASGKGVAKSILGVALIGGAIFMSGGLAGGGLLSAMGNVAIPGIGVTWGNIAVIGLGLTLAGAASLLSKPSETAEQKNSFNINGPGNSGKQGDAIQLIYGRTMVGSVNISFDANIEDMNAYSGVAAPSTRRRGGSYEAGL